MDVVWKNIGAVENVPVPGGRRLCFGHAGRPIAVFHTSEGGIYALADECPHKRGPLSEGIVSGDAVTCPLHNWTIGLKDGVALGPDEGSTQSFAVRVVNGEIHIGLPQTVETFA